jgi:hypothetical protein
MIPGPTGAGAVVLLAIPWFAWFAWHAFRVGLFDASGNLIFLPSVLLACVPLVAARRARRRGSAQAAD